MTTKIINNRGYFGIGIFYPKYNANIGTLWRSAFIFGADFIFVIGKQKHQCSDTVKSWRHTPLFIYRDFEDLYDHLPHSCKLIGIELDEKAKPIEKFNHPERAIYLLGNEANGIPNDVLTKCHDVTVLPGNFSMNVSVAGSIVMFDRTQRMKSNDNRV